MKNKEIKSLIIFSLITLLSGWLGYFIDKNIAPQHEEETLGMGLWLVLPLLITFIIRLFTKNWTGIGLNPRIMLNLKWYLFSLLIFPTVTFMVIILGRILGLVDTSHFNTQIYFTGLFLTLFPNFIKNIFEEFVWRGYLTSRLVIMKLNDLWVYLIVGGIWGAWHIPYYLFFLPETTIIQVLPVDRLTFAAIASVTMICWTVMYVELYRITKTIWPVVILHMVEDSAINHLILERHIIIMQKEFLISPIIGIITSMIYLSIGLILRKKRRLSYLK